MSVVAAPAGDTAAGHRQARPVTHRTTGTGPDRAGRCGGRAPGPVIRSSGNPPEAAGDTATVDVAVHASDPLAAAGAESMLKRDKRLRVVPAADSARADVIVVVETTVDDAVLATVRELRGEADAESPPRCVVVTDQLSTGLLIPAIQCGMAALLPRSGVSEQEVLRSVAAVHDGAAYLPPRFQGQLLAHLDRLTRDMLEPHGFTLSGVSAKERDVLRLLADGHNTDEIGSSLAYSASTVKSILYGLMRRHGLTTRSHAVAFALRTGAI